MLSSGGHIAISAKHRREQRICAAKLRADPVERTPVCDPGAVLVVDETGDERSSLRPDRAQTMRSWPLLVLALAAAWRPGPDGWESAR
jgi:hypothetical protein